jgi:hypothetical protein
VLAVCETAIIAPMASQATGTETRVQHRYAWLVAAAAVTTAETFASDLIHAGRHPPLVVALSFSLASWEGLLGKVSIVSTSSTGSSAGRCFWWRSCCCHFLRLSPVTSGEQKGLGRCRVW